MTAKLIVYSCVTSGYDQVHDTLFKGQAVPEEGVRYILFSDFIFPCTMRTDDMEWEVKQVKWSHAMCPSRTARYHKCLPHVVLPPHERSLWVDGSLAFKGVRADADIAGKFLVDGDGIDIATFKHPDRQCVYQEERACLKYRKDHAEIMRTQLAKYEKERYPPYNGLVETACLARRNNDRIRAFNEMWWKEIEAHSFRDQLSFNYVCWKQKLEYGHIDGERFKSPFFNHVNHPRR